MEGLAHIARNIGAFEVRLFDRLPGAVLQSTDPTALGALSLLAGLGLVMYVLMGKRRV